MITLEELEEYTSTNKDLKGFNISVKVYDCLKRDSHKKYSKIEKFEFNKEISDKDLNVCIYRDSIEFSSWKVSVPTYLREFSRTEDWRKELTTPQRIMEAFSKYFGVAKG